MLLLFSLKMGCGGHTVRLKKIASIPRFPKQGAEVGPQSVSTMSENLSFIRHLTSTLAEIFFALGLRAQATSHCAPNVGPLPRHEGDHFQPHYRMPFALMSGRRDGPFLIDIAASHCLLILWLSAAPPASYVNVGGCGIQNGNASSNHSASATQSGLQRNSLASYPKMRRICPYFAIIPTQTGP